ncbi:MAG: FtsX-like permease family protein [candidate division Zixibacteria bacterium]|nr:FtsX-like permease family protein [candidate division Zixibacteria bacterium]
MIWSIAWRNVWRNKKRSAIILTAVAFGIWAGLMSNAIMLGASRQMVKSAIETRTSHIQVHREGFRDHHEIDLMIQEPDSVTSVIKSIEGVKAISVRSVLTGMCRSPESGTGVTLFGIKPEDEARVSAIEDKLVDGSFFKDEYRNPIIVGDDLAKKLDVGVGNKIVVNAQDLEGSIAGGAFRVVGIFNTVSSEFDKSNVFALRNDIDEIYELGGGVHEIAVILNSNDMLKTVDEKLKNSLSNLDVATWEEIEPQMSILTGTQKQMSYIFIGIILLALVFGITNTMLMGVLERIRELGVVLSLGMNHFRIFYMILLETIFLSIIGAGGGMLATVGTIAVAGKTGIDLSIVSAGLEAFGMSTMLYPYLPAGEYPVVALMVVVTAVVASIYPGIKAIRLNPVEAIRTY